MRPVKARRYVFYFALIIIGICFYTKTPRFLFNSSSTRFTTQYNKYIDQNGNFLPYSGYKILQFIPSTSSSKLSDLYHFLDQRIDIKQYFKLVPMNTYHITLTYLKDKITYTEKELKLLKQEQDLLDKDVVSTKFNAIQLVIVDKNELRLEIQLADANYTKYLQKRWDEKFSELVLHHSTSFYIVLAYQFKDIPNGDLLYQMQVALKEWNPLPTDVDLDPTEICSYTSVVNYSILVPDIIETP